MAAEPIVNGLETELAGELEILQVDVYTPSGRELSKIYNNIGTPTFIFFDPNGDEVWRSFGSIDPDKVRESLP
ncbi:MAG: thioredoxin family protein [Anaerolineales bacterium]|nr:thioredoxin family protein [Anaerolineales bacterium]